ncbi:MULTISPECIES: isocitrate lyase/PEP mutase family protein [Pseudomonadota]
MKSIANIRADFRKRLLEGPPLVAMGAFDAFSAKLIQHAGFEAAYVGSYGVAASRGTPDVGLLTMEELVVAVASVAQAVDIPVIADGEGGFYNAANLWRAVNMYESSGACAIHIDDHESGKHSDLPRRVIPLNDMLYKLKAALEARHDPNFLIIGRTDAAWASGNIEDAVERMVAFAQTGADAVMGMSMTVRQLAEVRERIPAKVVILNAESATHQQEAAAGADLTIYHSFCLYAAVYGVQSALSAFKTNMTITDAKCCLASESSVEGLLDYVGFNERGQRYGMSQP